MTNSINTLCDQCAAFMKIKSEIEDLDAREKKALETLEAAAGEGGLDDPRVARKIAEAHSVLEFAKRRRLHVDSALKPALENLRAALSRADFEWCRVVDLQAKAIEDRFFKLCGKFFAGGEQEARTTITVCGLPGVDNKRDFYWNCDERGVIAATPDSIVNLVGSFVAVLKKHALKMDLTLPDRL